MSKKIKNMLSILFVAVLTVSAFCISVSAAEDDLTISISTDEIMPFFSKHALIVKGVTSVSNITFALHLSIFATFSPFLRERI